MMSLLTKESGIFFQSSEVSIFEGVHVKVIAKGVEKVNGP